VGTRESVFDQKTVFTYLTIKRLKLKPSLKLKWLYVFPALGSVHGNYQGEPKLGFEEMKHLSKLTDIPLVLHGGSGIPNKEKEYDLIAVGRA
jgi:fructose/tagatose bisphosphate aldolase